MTRLESILSTLSSAVPDLDVLPRGHAYMVAYTIRGTMRASVATDKLVALETAARDAIGRLERGTAEEQEAAERLRAVLSTGSTPPGNDGAGSE
jgi:hypothetical protein